MNIGVADACEFNIDDYVVRARVTAHKAEQAQWRGY